MEESSVFSTSSHVIIQKLHLITNFNLESFETTVIWFSYLQKEGMFEKLNRHVLRKYLAIRTYLLIFNT